MRKYNILQFCNKCPIPPVDGGAIGTNNVTRGYLDSGHNVKVLSFDTKKHPVDITKIPQSYLQDTRFEFVYVDLTVKPLPALINLLFSSRSYNIMRFYNAEMNNKLVEILKKEVFDFVQLEGIFLKDYIPTIRQYSNAKIIMRSPNIEYMIWQRLAEIEKNPFKAYYLNVLSKRLKREELKALNAVDAIYTVTENDMDIIHSLGVSLPITFVPTGIDVEKDLDTSKVVPEYPSLFYLGALDWFPNQEAVKWIVEEVWPSIHARFPELKLFIAGRKPPQWIQQIKCEGVEIVGEIDDAAEFIKSKAIMLVPLFSGSGMRVKIVEAMMLRKAIVTTTIGIEGIECKHGENVLIADTPSQFINEISALLNDVNFYESIRNNALLNANTHYSNEVLTKKLTDFLDGLVS